MPIGGELGIRAGEFWAFKHSSKLPLAKVVVIFPGRHYYDVIRVRLVDDPDHSEFDTRRAKLPCKWEDLESYLAAHPEVPRGDEVVAAAPVHIVHTTNELRALVHEEVSNALGVKKIAYTYDEASVAVGLSRDSLRVAVNRGDLVPRYVGSKPLFTAEELLRWLNTMPEEPWMMRR